MRARSLVVVMVAVTGCGGSVPPKPVASNTAVSEPVYAALFEAGRSWSLPIETASGHSEREYVIDATEHATVRCQVGAVSTVGGAKVSVITCAPPFDKLPIAGAWVATPKGLYHPTDAPTESDDVASLGEPWLADPPQERHDTGGTDESDWNNSVFRFGSGWCVRENQGGDGERTDTTLCVAAAGLAGGTHLEIYDNAKQWRRAAFGAAPPDPDDVTPRARTR